MPILSLFVGAHEYLHGRQWVIFIASAAMQPVRRTTVVTIHRRGVIFLIRRREYRDYWSVRRRRRGKQITAVLKRVRQIIFRRFKRCLPNECVMRSGVAYDGIPKRDFHFQVNFDTLIIMLRNVGVWMRILAVYVITVDMLKYQSLERRQADNFSHRLSYNPHSGVFFYSVEKYMGMDVLYSL